jgi:eukaryotic-like serine/threonine-protein kinase
MVPLRAPIPIWDAMSVPMIPDTDWAAANPGGGVGDIRPGVVLRDTYRVVRHLNAGGVGSVFVAAHERLPGVVAVKALQGDRIVDAESLVRFRAEAEVTALLKHPHIVQVLDFDVSPAGVPYFVMEYLDGVDLRTISAKGALDRHRVVRLCRQIAGALEAAHDAGVIHRDLKPENVMLIEAAGESDFVKVLDFGLLKVMHQEGPPVTKPDQILGTPGYMPPEQILGGRIDDRADQFSLAAMTYELLAGHAAFTGADPGALLRAIVEVDPPPLSSVVTWPADHVSAVLARGLAKLPEARYPNVAAFEQAFRAAIASDERSVTASGPLPPS